MTSKVLTIPAGTIATYEPASDALLDTSVVPLSVMVNPNGGTVTVNVKVAPDGSYQEDSDGALAGDITDVKICSLNSPVYSIKFTAATQTATVEINHQ